MIAWINVAVLVLSTLLCLYFYVRSAGPAAQEKVSPVPYVHLARNLTNCYEFLWNR